MSGGAVVGFKKKCVWVSFELQKICWTEIDTLDSDKKSVRNVTVKFILPV